MKIVSKGNDFFFLKVLLTSLDSRADVNASLYFRLISKKLLHQTIQGVGVVALVSEEGIEDEGAEEVRFDFPMLL